MKRLGCLLALRPEGSSAMVSRAMLDVALAHSPRVEEAGPALVYLDVAGLQGLFGDERQIGERLQQAAREVGVHARVGIAGSRIAALAAARLGSGITVIKPGDEAAYLAPAPLSLLDVSEEMAARLSRWGIRTLGELAALPPAGLFERLGSEGLRLQQLARGEDPRPLVPWSPPPLFEESVQCEWGMETLGPVVERAAELAGRLCARLIRRGLVADGFEWTCRLDDERVHDGALTLAVPMTDALAVASLLTIALESRPPRGIVAAITLRARPARVPPAQVSLTDRSRPSPRLVTATLARLAALVGVQRLGVPALLDSHRPDAVRLEPFSGKQKEPSPAPRRLPLLTLRRLRPPLPAGVTLASGRPVSLRSDRLTSRIVASAGPWRSSGEWWSESPLAQDEWDVELADGTLCRLAHDGSVWRLEGVYD